MHVTTNPIDILAGAVLGAVRTAVADPLVPAEPAAAPAITKEVVKKVAPVLAHLSNNEPWYRSRVTLGALVSAAAGLSSAFGFALAPEDQDILVGALLAAGTVIGAVITLYGRWKARKPLGTAAPKNAVDG